VILSDTDCDTDTDTDCDTDCDTYSDTDSASKHTLSVESVGLSVCLSVTINKHLSQNVC
jgi:hypothetical protein